MFQETFDYQNVIFICYKQQQALHLQSKAPNCQTWSIAQAITYTLMPIVKQCVLNQSQSYWLLLDALGSAFSLCIVIKVDVCETQALNQPFLRKDFDSKVQEFKLRMMGQVLNALGPFLAFSESYIVAKAHNMLAIMLDPCFKNMKIMWDFVGDSLALQVVAKYDAKIVYPLLVQTYLHLNLVKVVVKLVIVEDDDNFFRQNIFNDDAIMSIVRNEMHLFHRLSVGPMEIKNPLQWWANHAMQFPHVSFLACYMLGIVGSQIEIERIFNVTSIITNL